MHTCSRPLSDLLIAGWEMERATLAEMWLPVRATARKTSTWEREKGTFTSGATMTEPGKIPVGVGPPELWLAGCPVPTETPACWVSCLEHCSLRLLTGNTPTDELDR